MAKQEQAQVNGGDFEVGEQARPERGAILVGRGPELRRLQGLLQRALAGDVGVGLISGPAGNGKTRLLEELAQRGAALGFAVAWGRGWELGAPPSYWPWIEIFRSLLARPDGREGAAALAHLLPEVDSAASPARTASTDVFQLYDVADRYLEEAARRQPLLLLLDDLHVADASSLQLAEFVLRQRRGRRLVLLASHRQLELRRRPELQRSLSRLAREAELCELGSLSVDDVAEWLELARGRSDRDAAVELQQTSGGNPLFVRELLRQPTGNAGETRAPLPEGIRSLLRERFALLEPSQLQLLHVAAVLGRSFSAALVAEVARAPLAAVDAALHEAAAVELLDDRLHHLGAGSWSFRHASIAEALLADSAPAERAARHRAAAEVLEQRHAAQASAPWSEIAHHWLAAGADAAPRAVAAAVKAAAAAEAQLAFAEAARCHEQALAALELAAPADGAQRGALLVRRAEALARADQREVALATCRQALALARELRDGELFARAALALGTEAVVGAADEPVVRCLEEALVSLPAGDGALRALVLARLASARQPARDPEAPMQLARDAIAMAQRLGQPQALLHTLDAALGALMDYAPATERLPLNRETLRLARSLGDRPRALRASLRVVFDRAELGDVDGFAGAVRDHAALAEEIDQPRHRWVVPMFRSMRANWEGRFSDADQLEQLARAQRDQGCDEGVRLVPARALLSALLRRDSGALERAVTKIRRANPEDRSLASFLVALLACVRGQLDVARREVAELRARGVAPFADAPAAAYGGASDLTATPVSGYLHLPEVTSEIAWALGDVPLARTLYAELLPLAGRPCVVTSTAFSLHGVVDHALMRLGTWVASEAQVDAFATSALELCARLGAAPIAAQVQHDWARILSRRAQPESGAQARALAGNAARAARELGMLELAHTSAELEQQLTQVADLPVPSPPAPLAAGSVQLLLEGDIWTLRSGPLTCRVRDTRGMRMLAQLIDNAGRELHVLELSGLEQAVDGGDAGALLDREAQRAYLLRLRELDAALEEASSWNDLARREQLLAEAETLRNELSRAFGKGGRERRGGSAVERARINVRRRLTVALQQIERASPELARQLWAALRTGVYCLYQARS